MKLDTPGGAVSAAWHGEGASTVVVLAHGAGGNMNTSSLRAFADGLAAKGFGAVRFNFPYSEAGRKSPGGQGANEAAYRAVAEQIAAERLVLGGRSYGGRIASHIVAQGFPASGLLFLAYPLHAPGKTEQLRDAHLREIAVPMLFLQGDRDTFARADLLEKTIAGLPTARLHRLAGGDHSHRVRGRRESEVVDELVAASVEWLRSVPAAPAPKA